MSFFIGRQADILKSTLCIVTFIQSIYQGNDFPYVYFYICTHAHTYIHTHTCIFIHTHIHTHTPSLPPCKEATGCPTREFQVLKAACPFLQCEPVLHLLCCIGLCCIRLCCIGFRCRFRVQVQGAGLGCRFRVQVQGVGLPVVLYRT